MKKFLLRLLYLIPVPIIIIVVNYFVDPANIFNTKYVTGITDYLIQGYNVADISNYDERTFQKDYTKRMKQSPDQIILGSSRVMIINKDMLGNDNVINNGVSGATLEDILATYYLHEEKGDNIEKVLIGIDPWMLNDNHKQTRWKTLSDEYYSFLDKIGSTDNSKPQTSSVKSYVTKYKELLSLSYFKTSANYLITGKKKKYRPTLDLINDGATRLIDGSITYDKTYRTSSPEKVETKVVSMIAKDPIYSMGNYTRLSESYCAILSSFVDYMQNKNIKVEILLTPFHPLLYDYFKTNKYYNIVFKAENYIVDLAQKKDIKIYGTYNPAKNNLSDSCFYDGLHPKPQVLQKLINLNSN